MPALDIEKVLGLALRAPTAGNAQPYTFKWDGQRLEIFVDLDRVPLRDLHFSFSQLGCLLEAIDVAASREGARVTRVEGPSSDEGRPALVLGFDRSCASPSPLAGPLADRITDRRLYAGGPLEDSLRAQLEREFVDGPVRLHLLKGCPEELVEHLADWESRWFEWPRLTLGTMLRWVRWSEADANRTGDGTHWATLGMSYLGSRIFKAVQHWPRLLGFVRDLVARRGMMRATRLKLHSAAGVALITTRDGTPEQCLTAGRRFLRAELLLQAAGHSLQLMNLGPSLLAAHRLSSGLPKDLPAALRDFLPRSAELFTKHFRLEQGEIATFFFRFGRSPGPLPPKARTARKPLADVLTLAGESGYVRTNGP